MYKRQDVGRAAIGFNLAANPADGGCQGVFVHKPFVYIPQLFQKLPTGQHLPGIFTKQVQMCIRDRLMDVQKFDSGAVWIRYQC